MRPLTFEKARRGVSQLTGYLHKAATLAQPSRPQAPPASEPAALEVERTRDDEWSRFDALEPRFVALIARLDEIAQRA